ncbi:MAG: 3-deoxy-D-manno-octulosonic acid transferase [Luteitalea sp.]|nr:3-deoxy-D-manno-octulosonic acid transferase [Luteitalea sp.]
MYLLYSALSFVAFVLATPYFAYRALRHGKYIRGISQRLGSLPESLNADREPSIWIHAVSVGETLTVRPLVDGLRARYPHHKLFLSTTTRAGQEVARARLASLDGVFYFPFDWTGPVRRALDSVCPQLFVMMETELWPNLLRACRARGVRTVLVNGRLSARSHGRYRLVRPFFRHVLADVDLLLVQGQTSAQRFVSLGADPTRVIVTGSLKFDSLDWSAASSGDVARGRDRILRYFRVPESRVVIMAASTLRGEELAALRAFRSVQAQVPDALLIVAPRHPERFDEVVQLVSQEGYRVVRRTELEIDREPAAGVIVLDTMGELARLYKIATVVFVGGSLVDGGGHNILEPALFAKPVLFGPHMRNFAEIADAFVRNGAGLQVRDGSHLATEVLQLAGDPVRRASLGAAARALVEANRGAKERTLEEIERVLPPPPRDERGRVETGGHASVVPFRRG